MFFTHLNHIHNESIDLFLFILCFEYKLFYFILLFYLFNYICSIF